MDPSHKQPQYRRIQPAAGHRSSSTSAKAPQSLPPRRKSSLIACDACRSKKSACNGKLPCATCVRRGRSCTYSTSRGRDSEIVRRLSSLPYEDAIQLLRILRRASGADCPRLPPALPANQMPAHNSLELELFNRHSIAYPPLFPVQVASLPLDTLLRPTRLPRAQPLTGSGPTSETHIPDSTQTSLYVGPLPSKPLVDDRLPRVDITKWTDVSVPSDLALRAISLYIEVDYPVFPVFHLDLFLEDLIHVRQRYCCRLLVSSLLCWAFLAYTALNSEAAAWSVAFFNEAMALLDQETSQNTITAMAALQLLSMAAATYGKDELGVHLLREGVGTGKRLGLFRTKGQPEINISETYRGDDSWKKAATYTTWGLFNWVSLRCLHYQRPEIEIPSTVPMPGGADTVGTDATTSTITQSGAPGFNACCKLWTIFNEVLWKYYGSPPGCLPSLEVAKGVYHRLLSWAASLPPSLARSDQNSHSVIIMHIYFHAIVTDLFRPFLRSPSHTILLNSFRSAQAVPEAIHAASVNQLKQLLLTFRLNCKTASFSIFWQTGLIYVANAMIREATTNSPEWRFYLALCLAGTEDLHGSFRISRAVAQGLLSMALQHRAISFGEARRVVAELQELGRHHTAVLQGPLTANEQEIEATWIVDLELAMVDRESAQCGKSAAKCEELLLLDEFTTGVADG